SREAHCWNASIRTSPTEGSHQMDRTKRAVSRILVVGAVVAGAALGSYGIASAASGSSPNSSSSTSPSSSWGNATTAKTAQSTAAPNTQNPWGAQRSDETVLTGDTAAKVKSLALAKVGSSATVVRVETDADGHAAYEAHM